MTFKSADSPTRWYFCAAVDAHPSRLPAGYVPGGVRGLRRASATLMRGMHGRSSVDDALKLLGAGLPMATKQWRRHFLAAGVRALSSTLRRNVGEPLCTRLADEMGRRCWRVALQWTRPVMTYADGQEQQCSDSLVECVGAEIVLAQLDTADGLLTRRMRLRYAEADVQYCMAALQASAPHDRAAIASVALGPPAE